MSGSVISAMIRKVPQLRQPYRQEVSFVVIDTVEVEHMKVQV